ncbi:hypothetical protein [Microbispora bryophytorum]|uniref:hypothetical protein n=1 Tax=Microbispora bryophytorum TaxID=1460882 RepID=UPI0033DB4926
MLVYLKGRVRGETAFALAAAVSQIVRAFDLETVDEVGPRTGSLAYWFRARRRDLQKASETDLGQEITSEIKRALQLRAVDAEQAKVDDSKASAVAKLIAAVEGQPTAVVQVGALLLVKANGLINVRDLTPQEVVYLRRNPHAVADPITIMKRLQEIADSTPDDSHSLLELEP